MAVCEFSEPNEVNSAHSPIGCTRPDGICGVAVSMGAESGIVSASKGSIKAMVFGGGTYTTGAIGTGVHKGVSTAANGSFTGGGAVTGVKSGVYENGGGAEGCVGKIGGKSSVGGGVIGSADGASSANVGGIIGANGCTGDTIGVDVGGALGGDAGGTIGADIGGGVGGRSVVQILVGRVGTLQEAAESE